MLSQRSLRLAVFGLALAAVALLAEGCATPDTHLFAEPVAQRPLESMRQLNPLSGFLPDPESRDAHSSSLITLLDGSVRAFWMYGREGAQETVIATAKFDVGESAWSGFSVAADVSQTTRDIGARVRKVGNAVPWITPDGRLHLIYVVTSIGGWAGSYLVYRSSEDQGMTWGKTSRIRTSPFLNLGTLVRSAPVAYQDGTFGLPVYHELLGKYSELLHLDAQLRVVDRHRITASRASLQPALVTIGSNTAIAMMRNPVAQSPRTVLTSLSTDGGQSWVDSDNAGLLNPGSPVAVMRLADGDLLAVLNPNEAKRRELVLAIKRDESQWRIVRYIESATEAYVAADVAQFAQSILGSMARVDGNATAAHQTLVDRAAYERCRRRECDTEYSYPYWTRLRDGRILLTYTWNRVAIRWLLFDDQWIHDGLESSSAPNAVKP